MTMLVRIQSGHAFLRFRVFFPSDIVRFTESICLILPDFTLFSRIFLKVAERAFDCVDYYCFRLRVRRAIFGQMGCFLRKLNILKKLWIFYKKGLRLLSWGPRYHFTGGAEMHQGDAGRAGWFGKRIKNRDIQAGAPELLKAHRFCFVCVAL